MSGKNKGLYLFPKGEALRFFIATLEVSAFLKQGINHFGNTKAQALRSFIIFFAMFPLDYAFLYVLRGDFAKLQDFSFLEICYYDSLRLILLMLFSITIVYALCKIHKKTQYFPRFVIGMNWLNLIQMFFYLPILVFLWSGLHSMDDMSVLVSLFLLYYNIVAVFFIKHSLKISWPMSAYVVFVIFIADEIGSQMLLY